VGVLGAVIFVVTVVAIAGGDVHCRLSHSQCWHLRWQRQAQLCVGPIISGRAG